MKRAAPEPVASVPTPSPDEPRDPILEAIRDEIKNNRVIHTYGYEADLDSFLQWLKAQRANRANKPSLTDSILPAESTTTFKEGEEVPKIITNPKTMWAYGVTGAGIGFLLAAVLMRKHVEPLTSTVYASLTGIGGFTGAKLDQKGLLPPIPHPYFNLAPPPPTRRAPQHHY